MKNYQSSTISSARPQSYRTQYDLQPILQYPYQQSAGKVNVQMMKYKTNYGRDTENGKGYNKGKKEESRRNENMYSTVNNKKAISSIINKQDPKSIKAKSSLNSQSSYSPVQIQPLSNPSSKKPHHPTPTPPPQPFTIHNPPTPYPTSLFPQPQTLKQQLKQNVQQQMLNNYYISKYSQLMSKLINDHEIRVELPKELNQRSGQRQDRSQKKRQNFKQVMKLKTNQINKRDNMQGMNQSVKKKPLPTHFQVESNRFDQPQEQYIHDHSEDYHPHDQFNSLTFSPLRAAKLFQDDPDSKKKQKPIVKSINKTRERINYESSQSKARPNQVNNAQKSPLKSNISQKHSQSPSRHLRSNNPHSPQKITQNKSPSPGSSLKQSTLQLKQSQPGSSFFQLSNSPYQGQRQNFKHQMHQRRNLHLQYEQNFQLYKKLQSSIINELYSPSPKKIEARRENQIEILDRELSEEEKRQMEEWRKRNDSFGFAEEYDRSNLFTDDKLYHPKQSNIQIIDDQYNEDQLYDHQESYPNEQSNQVDMVPSFYTQFKQPQKNLFNDSKKDMSPLRQSIRQSLHRNNSSKHSSKHQSSQNTPLSSPRRSLISYKANSKVRAQQVIQKESSWNSHFSSTHSYNKKILLSPKRNFSNDRQGNSQGKRYHSMDNRSNIQKKQSPQKFSAKSSQKSFKLNPKSTNPKQNLIKQQDQPVESDIEHQNNSYQQQQSIESYNQVAHKLANSFNLQQDVRDHVSFKNHNHKKSNFNYFPESRLISQNTQPNQHRYQNSNETVNSPSEFEDPEEIQFIPAASQFASGNENIGVPISSGSPRRNLIQTIPGTRSRKQSEQLSFISQSINHNELSMLSRFSMTSEEGSVVMNKLQTEITQNQFGPYQQALQNLRDLLTQYKTAWPIYIVSQKVLEDRQDYQKKIQLQQKMLEDYKQKIIKLKEVQNKNFDNEEQNIIYQNKIKILKLVRELAHRTSSQ